MLTLKILLTFAACYGLYRLQDAPPSSPQTVCASREARRGWTLAATALTAAMWLTDSWWVAGAAMLVHLGMLVCRNACIQWDERRVHISGLMGLRWDYEYAQLRYLPGRLPLIITTDHFFLLWPGMPGHSDFLQAAWEQVRLAVKGQAYRKRGWKTTRQNIASQNAVYHNIILALCLAALVAYLYWPVTASTGDVVELTLERAWERRTGNIGLDFGESRDYRIALNEKTAELLEEDALGQTYTIQRRYRPGGKHGNSWYQVLALEAEDGTVYRTWEDSARTVDRGRPAAFATAVVAWFMIAKRAAKVKTCRRR